MKTLDKNEWVAVIVAIFVVGFFFVFGQTLVSFFTSSNTEEKMLQESQLQIQDNPVGTGEMATQGSTVTVHYTGRLTDGTIFDSSLDRNEPFKFVLGDARIIKGWNQGISGMRVGGKRILIIPAELGYGAEAVGQIPPNSTLIFEVDLLNVEK